MDEETDQELEEKKENEEEGRSRNSVMLFIIIKDVWIAGGKSLKEFCGWKEAGVKSDTEA